MKLYQLLPNTLKKTSYKIIDLFLKYNHQYYTCVLPQHKVYYKGVPINMYHSYLVIDNIEYIIAEGFILTKDYDVLLANLPDKLIIHPDVYLNKAKMHTHIKKYVNEELLNNKEVVIKGLKMSYCKNEGDKEVSDEDINQFVKNYSNDICNMIMNNN